MQTPLPPGFTRVGKLVKAKKELVNWQGDLHSKVYRGDLVFVVGFRRLPGPGPVVEYSLLLPQGFVIEHRFYEAYLQEWFDL
jgi:hypothetical protein